MQRILLSTKYAKQLLILTANLFLLAHTPSVLADEQKCKCDFDTASYSAECDCALACAVAMKEGKHCNIVCDGAPQNAAKGDTAIFGSRKNYLYDMAYIRHQILSESVGFFSPYNEKAGLFALPRFLRSSYIGAKFISDQEKLSLDKLVHELFKEYGKRIWQFFTDKKSNVFEKAEKNNVFLSVSHFYITIKTPDIILQLSIVT